MNEQADEKMGRWVEPQLTDVTAFRLDHPETVVSSDLLDRLERRIARLAATYEFNHAAREDVRAAIRLRIIEAATGSRADDDDGHPIHDYLSQSDSYIVRHAAGRVWNELRHERRTRSVSFPLSSLGALAGAGDNRETSSVEVDPPLPCPGIELETEITSQINADEISLAVAARVSPAQRRVFALLTDGLARPEIGRRLGLDRRTISCHVTAIRRATLEVLARRSETDLIAEVGRRSPGRRVAA